MLKLKRTLFCVVFVLSLVSLASSEAQAKTFQVNDGKIEYITYDSNVLVIKLSSMALGYGWTGWGADELARHAIWLAERDGKSCRNVKISKLARQIQLHCIANTIPFGNIRIPKWGSVRSHANPVNVTWREIS